MTEKRFKIKKLEYEAYYVDTKQEYIDEDELDLKFDGLVTMTDKQVVDLLNENEQLRFENNELKCALALDSIDYILADGKKIDIPPYYEFENRYKNKKYRREEYDEY